MRRLLTAIAAGAFLVGLAAPGGAGATPAPRVAVPGAPTYPRITVRVHAFSDADGSNPRGALTVRSADIGQRRRGEVTCLNVQGKMATIGIRIVQSEDPAAIGKGELFAVVDNGDDAERIAGYEITPTAPTVCP